MIVWAFETLIATTLLMLLVLAIRRPAQRSFGPTVAYALWSIPALRMILPPLPDSWHKGVAAPLSQASQTLVYYVAEPLGVPSADTVTGGPAIWPWLLAAWAIGAIGFIGYHLVSHGRFVARVRRMAQSVRIVAAGKVEVIETDAATGPLAFGVWRKYVAFPRDFAERYDELERDLALAHELGHHARGDLLANWAALVMLGLHWFNPVAWRAFRAFRADQEMACDALVLAGRAAALRHAYGRAIVKSAHGGAVSAACHLHTINEIKGRLKMLGVHEKTSKSRMLAGAGALAALTLGGLGLTASGTQAAERVRTSVESAVGVDLATLDMPSLSQSEPLPPPPGPPAPPRPIAGHDVTRQITTTTGPDGKVKRHVRVILRDKDGKVRELSSEDGDIDIDVPADGAGHKRSFMFRSDNGKVASWDKFEMPPEALASLKNLPEITSRDCRDGEGRGDENVIHDSDGKKRRTIICTNRIAQMSANAAASADALARTRVHMMQFASSQDSYALQSLRRARNSIASNSAMSDAQRASALSGIDQAIREMEAKKD